jgi:hypothetical protein
MLGVGGQPALPQADALAGANNRALSYEDNQEATAANIITPKKQHLPHWPASPEYALAALN